MGLDLEAIRDILTFIRHFLDSIHHILTSIRHFHDSIHHFPNPIHYSSSPRPPQLPQPKQKAHQQLGELSDNLLILVFGFEGAFHFAFGFFFAHVVAFVVVFFPFADAD